jgi:hypothetical protein
MVGGLDRHHGPAAEATLVVGWSLGVLSSMRENMKAAGGGCFCGGVFLSGVDFFGGRCGSWLQKATAATAIVVPVLRSR